MDAIRETLEIWGNELVARVPNMVVAVLVLVTFVIIGKIARRAVAGVMQRASDSRAVAHLLSTMAYVFSIAIGAVIALNVLELGGAATSLLAGAGVVGIALGFAFQDIAANFISGIIIAFQKPMRVGDLVETNDYYGVVKNITLRMTQIQTLQGQMVFIPNKDILLNPLIEYNTLKKRRIDLDCGVRYSDDLEKTKEVAIEAVKKLKTTNADQPIDLYFHEFGDSSINFTIRFWTGFKNETDFLEARSQAVIAIKQAFDNNGISIPFPIRTLEGTVSVKE